MQRDCADWPCVGRPHRRRGPSIIAKRIFLSFSTRSPHHSPPRDYCPWPTRRTAEATRVGTYLVLGRRMLLLFADTLKANTTPQSVHEIRFSQPVLLQGFRVVCDGEKPHAELSFEGQTPPTQLTLEIFGCEHGDSTTLCIPLLSEPHRRQGVGSPSTMVLLAEVAATTRCTYLVIR